MAKLKGTPSQLPKQSNKITTREGAKLLVPNKIRGWGLLNLLTKSIISKKA